MGVAGLCCTNKDIKKSVLFTPENNKNDNNNINKENKNIEENYLKEKNDSTSPKFNKNGSQVINAISFKQSNLHFEEQKESDDDFENMYNKLSRNTDSIE